MIVYSLNDWFDNLPEDFKDRLADLCYQRDMDIANQAILDWSITFLKKPTKQNSKHNSSTHKPRKIPINQTKLYRSPITDEYILDFMQFIGLSAKDMDDNYRSHNA